MSNGFNELAEGTGKLLKIVPELYDDGLKPTVQESGKLLARIPRAVNSAFASLDIWILNRDYNVEATKKLIEKKLENVNPENIVDPEPYVAVPAIQAISYSMNSDELRNLYANLIANSMNTDTKDNVHPAFVEIIKQLSPFEANLLKSFIENTSYPYSYPIIKIRRNTSESDASGVDFAKHILDAFFGININNYKEYAISIDNLMRLNLITVDYQKSLQSESFYKTIEYSPLISELKDTISGANTFNYPFIEKGVLEISNLGESFSNICIY